MAVVIFAVIAVLVWEDPFDGAPAFGQYFWSFDAEFIMVYFDRDMADLFGTMFRKGFQ